ncbi:hypothetical protein B194_3794 [Serratia plymuthica A30]|nr:hypothetical protein B194_3794 [Serratia plymuthica A30]
MLYRRVLQPQSKSFETITRRLFYGGRAFCLKVHVKKTLFFTSTSS